MNNGYIHFFLYTTTVTHACTLVHTYMHIHNTNTFTLFILIDAMYITKYWLKQQTNVYFVRTTIICRSHYLPKDLLVEVFLFIRNVWLLIDKPQ